MSRKRRFRPPRRLRATRAGWCFIAIIFGVGFAALNTGNNLLYLVLALMLAFLVLSGLLSEASLRGIRVERRLPRELFAGGPNRIVLRVHNDQKRVAAFAISVEDLLESSEDSDDEAEHRSRKEKRREKREAKRNAKRGGEGGLPDDRAGRSFVLRIAPNEKADRSYVFEPEQRGDLRFERLRISTRFPFGLFVKSAELDLPESALVYPEIFETLLREDETAAGDDPEVRSGGARRGDDLAGLREFVAGDSVGRVHWRRTLQAGRLLIGEREGEASGEIEVLLSLAAGLPPEVIENRIAQAASEILAALEAGLRVGLRSPQVRIPPGLGTGHRTELLSYLARVDAKALSAGTHESDPRARAGGEQQP